ncbi:DNA polymerase III subunit delta [Sphingomonas carotinifaciens]|uniref:DNA polymerase III subunit delta n=1 Tax=Sphingomonas carotinifaciens TaxID=1166323 RepID=UPI000DDBA4E4|nr:DNA polymerase III subunit delta [Sphingomonas carotinifaciens]
MKASSNQIRQALDKPSPDIRLYLLHGPDEATAVDLAHRLAKAMGPEAERIDLDPATLKNDPARLADEAASLSLFGGARYVRITAVGEEGLAAFSTLLDADRAGNPVVAIAPSVKTSARIVKLATDSRRAMAFGCYAPSAADAERMVMTLAGELGMRPATGVARRLVDATAADRSVLMRELEKLALYLDAAPDRVRELAHDALDAVGADLGEAEMGQAVEAVVEGRVAELGGELTLLDEGGASPIPWLRALSRRLVALAEMRAEIETGEPVDAVMKRHRVFFRDEAQTARALRRWTPMMLSRALARIRAAERAVVAPGNAGSVLAEAEATVIAQGIARRG